jgi:hypothetical protein
MEIEIGKKYKYCGKDDCIVLEKDKTHVLIQFDSGQKIATTHSALNPNYGESEFEGSPLQTELRNAHGEKFSKLKAYTLSALENKPTSLFWQKANQFINEKQS